MCDPRILCRQHLLGEHNELHKIVGSLQKERSISGYIKHNCIEVKSILNRHELLIEEMIKRGYNHRSPLPSFNYSYLPLVEQIYVIDRENSLQDLINRCNKCNTRYKEAMK